VDATDHFALFDLSRTFALDAAQLEAAWKHVAQTVHPDRFATRSAPERRVAMQWSAQANEAYRVLRQPLLRARYLCELAGVDLQTETNTAMAPEFLVQQMSWHEQLDECLEHPDNSGAREALIQEIELALAQCQHTVSKALDAEQYTQAASCIREWMFLDKLTTQLQTIEV
jgi:molecular chaperone HscB